MVGDQNRRSTLIHSATGVFSSKNSLYDEGAIPHLAYPAQVSPRYCRLRQRRAYVNQRHWTLSRDDDVLQLRNPAIAQETCEPSRMGHDFRKERHFFQNAAAKHLFHSI